MNVLVIGADRGLGKILSLKLAESGHNVIAGVFDIHNVHMTEFESGGILVHQMDVSNEASLKATASKLEENKTTIDAVVHVAGVLMSSDREKDLLEADMNDFLTAFQINTAGIVIAFRTFYPLMVKGGMYIAVTSEGGSFSGAGAMFPEYCITKTAANKVVQILRYTVNDVEVIAMHPGRMNTEMGRTTAQIEPDESAAGICNIIERKTKLEPDNWFIDYKGEKMPL